jgi:hypothetical protein
MNKEFNPVNSVSKPCFPMLISYADRNAGLHGTQFGVNWD